MSSVITEVYLVSLLLVRPAASMALLINCPLAESFYVAIPVIFSDFLTAYPWSWRLSFDYTGLDTCSTYIQLFQSFDNPT